MRILRAWLSRFGGLFGRQRRDRVLSDELDSHLQMHIEDNLQRGMTPAEARRQALIKLGGVEQTKETYRERRGLPFLETLLQDIRFGFRMLRKSPGFTAVAVLTLALGIGANTAIFSLMDQVMLQLLPVKHPEQLVLVAERGIRLRGSWGDNDISYPMYRDFRDGNQVFSGMFGRYPTIVSLGYGDHTDRVAAELVSGSYFPVLGVTAAIGRTLTPDDDRVPGGDPVAMLSYSFWQNRFSSDPSIVGRKIVLNGYSFTVIGVSQPRFDGVELGYKSQVFIPMMMQAQMTPLSDRLEDRSLSWVTAFGRLKPGVDIAKAKASLQPLMHDILEVEVQEPWLGHFSNYDRAQFLKNSVDLLPGSQGWSNLREHLQTPLWVLAALSGAVLLLACANLANLLLARATTREREMAVRLAIGAGRRRIIRQLLVESLSLATIGTGVGLFLAFLADRVLLAAYFPADSAVDLPISPAPDARVFLFALAATVLTAVVFGLAPAIQCSRADVAPALKDRAGSVARGKQVLLRKLLVSGQVALALSLLIGASLLVRTLANLESSGPGFSTEHLMAFTIDPSLNGYVNDRAKDFFRRLNDDLQAVPGVTSVGMSAMPLLEGYGWRNPVIAEGYSADPGQEQVPICDMISPKLFATLGVPIVAGRDFTVLDTRPVAIINETLARKYFTGRNPVGLHIGMVDDRTATPDTLNLEIIGVVKDLKYENLRDPAPPQAYFPYWHDEKARFMTYYLRARVDPQQLTQAVREQVRRLDPNVPVVDMRTVEGQIGLSLTTERLVASLSSVFGLVATALAVIGLYGAMAYSVVTRRHEIGIRMALGAKPADVMRLVLGQGLKLAVLGVGTGVLASFVLTRLMSGLLYGVSSTDPLTFILVAVMLTVVALLACYIPARRAMKVDPMVALRYE